MIRTLILLLTIIFSTAIYAQDAYTKTEIDLKLQLQQKEVDEKLRVVEDKEIRIEQAIASQDKRVDEANGHLTIIVTVLGIFIAVIAVIVAVAGIYAARQARKAKDDAEKEIAVIKNWAELEVEKARLEVSKKMVEVDGCLAQIKASVGKASEHLDEAKDHLNESKKLRTEIDASTKENKNSEKTVALNEKVEEVVKQIDERISADDWFFKGYNASKKDKYEDAFFYYKKAAELDPNDVEIYFNWGNVLCDLAEIRSDENLYKEAIEKFKKASELDPDDSDIYYNWGIALYDLAKIRSDEDLFLESIEKYEKATNIDPDYTAAYTNWGYSLIALAILKDTLIKDKEQIESRLLKAEHLREGGGAYNLTVLHSFLGDLDTAFKWFEVMLDKRKDYTKQEIESDTDFDNIRHDPRYKELLDKYRPEKG